MAIEEARLIINTTVDEKAYEESLKNLEKPSEEAGQKTGEKYSQGFSQTVSKAIGKPLKDSVTKAAEETGKSLGTTLAKSVALGVAGIAAIAAAPQLKSLFGSILGNIGQIAAGFASLVASKASILGLADAAIVLGFAFRGVTEALSIFGPQVASISSLLSTVSIGATAVGAVILTALKGIAEFVSGLGDKMVEFADKVTQSFTKADTSTRLLKLSIDNINRAFDGAVGTSEEWIAAIDNISRATGLNRAELQKAASELIFVGAQLGLTKEQIQRLTLAVVDFSTITGDVVQTAFDFSSALNGASSSVIKYGIKLNEANIANFALKKGIQRASQSFTEEEKVILRTAKILETHNIIAGQAIKLSDTLAGSEKRLENSFALASQEIGRGAAVIEGLQLKAFLFDKVIRSIPEGLLNVTGFLTALIGRMLSLGGTVAKVVIEVSLLVNIFKLLNLALKTNIAQSLIATVTNQNLALAFGVLGTSVTTVSGAFVALGNIFKYVFAAIVGANGALTGTAFASSVLAGIAGRLSAALAFLGGIAKTVFGVIFSEAAAIIAIVVGAIYALVRAFTAIEARTKAFSTIFKAFVGLLEGVSPIVEAILRGIKALANFILTVFFTAIGGLAEIIASVTDKFLALIELNPFKVFGKKQVEQVKEARKSIALFRSDLTKAFFDIRELEKNLGREPASDPLAGFKNKDIVFAKFIEDNKTFLAQNKALFIQYATDLNALSTTQVQTLNDLALTSAESRKVVLDKALEETKARQQEILDLQNGFRTGLQNTFTGAFEAIGASFVQGNKAFKDFGRSILGTLGDLAIKAGFLISGMGKALTVLAAALTNPFTGPAAIIAGIALIALGGALKALSHGKGGLGASPTTGTNTTGSNAPSSGTNTEGTQGIQEAGPSVQLIVQGNILDRRQTGLELAEVIREAVGKGAVVYT